MCISVSVCTVCITVSPLPAGCSCCGWTMNSSTATPPYMPPPLHNTAILLTTQYMPPRCTILHNTEQYCTILHIRRAAPSTILLLMLHRQSVAQQIHHNSIQQPPPSHVLDQHIHKTNALGAMLKKSIATREHWTSHCKGALLSQIWLDWIKSQLYLWHCRLGCWTGRCAHCTVTGYCTVYSAHCIVHTVHSAQCTVTGHLSNTNTLHWTGATAQNSDLTRCPSNTCVEQEELLKTVAGQWYPSNTYTNTNTCLEQCIT